MWSKQLCPEDSCCQNLYAANKKGILNLFLDVITAFFLHWIRRVFRNRIVFSLRNQFSWVLTLIPSLADLDKPSSEHLALQVELRSLQSACRLKEEEFDKQKQVLQTQLQVEVSDIKDSLFQPVWETAFCFLPWHLFSKLRSNVREQFMRWPLTYDPWVSADGALCSAKGSADWVRGEITLDNQSCWRSQAPAFPNTTRYVCDVISTCVCRS